MKCKYIIGLPRGTKIVSVSFENEEKSGKKKENLNNCLKKKKIQLTGIFQAAVYLSLFHINRRLEIYSLEKIKCLVSILRISGTFVSRETKLKTV